MWTPRLEPSRHLHMDYLSSPLLLEYSLPRHAPSPAWMHLHSPGGGGGKTPTACRRDTSHPLPPPQLLREGPTIHGSNHLHDLVGGEPKGDPGADPLVRRSLPTVLSTLLLSSVSTASKDAACWSSMLTPFNMIFRTSESSYFSPSKSDSSSTVLQFLNCHAAMLTP